MISSSLDNQEKLLEIKITDKEMDFEIFERKYKEELVEKLTKNIPKKPMIGVMFLAYEIKGHSFDELTAFVQTEIDENPDLRGKVEIKIMKLK